MLTDCYSDPRPVLPPPPAVMTRSVARESANGMAQSKVPEHATILNAFEISETTATRLPNFIRLQAKPGADAISTRIVNASHVRLELVHCHAQGVVHWRAAGGGMHLMLVRTRTEEARITFSGAPSEHIGGGRAQFWFFPDAAGAQGEICGNGSFGCAGVSVDPSVLPFTLKAFFTQPVSGLLHDRLRRSFDALVADLEGPEYVTELVAEGWLLRLLAHVAQASQELNRSKPKGVGGLAPWQLRRATALLRANLAENQSLEHLAAACRLSATHFARAFKQSMGIPPHQWLTNARIDMARELLLRSALPLAQIASTCGFADQSHFSRIFSRSEGVSPGAWRRQHH